MKQQPNSGFTVVELMIVVAIIGILSTVALPQYQNYTVQAKVTEALSLAEPAEAWIAQGYMNGDVAGLNAAAAQWNAQAANAGASSKYVTSILVSDFTKATPGLITITYSSAVPQLASFQMTLTPSISGALLVPGMGGPIDWACASSTARSPNANGLPAAISPTPLPAQYAPLQCQ